MWSTKFQNSENRLVEPTVDNMFAASHQTRQLDEETCQQHRTISTESDMECA